MTIINKEDFKIKKELNRPILSLDYGENKVGIAISDGNCSIALPSEVYIRNKTDKDFIYIKEFIKKKFPNRYLTHQRINRGKQCSSHYYWHAI